MILDARPVRTSLLVLGVTLLLTGTATSQPQAPGQVERKEELGKVEPELEIWVQLLAGHFAHKNDAIRASAQQALIAVGEPAVPTLQKLAQSRDPAVADTARRLLARLGRPMPSERPGDFLAKAGLKVGDPLPDAKAYDAEGKEFRLRALKGYYTVLVFGCLT